MIAEGADVNQAQPDGTTPLHWAVYRVDRELVAALLKKGRARTTSSTSYGASPLAEAVRVANLEICRDAARSRRRRQRGQRGRTDRR